MARLVLFGYCRPVIQSTVQQGVAAGLQITWVGENWQVDDEGNYVLGQSGTLHVRVIVPTPVSDKVPLKTLVRQILYCPP